MRTLPTLPDIPAGVMIWNAVDRTDLEEQLRDLAAQGRAIMAAADAEGRVLTTPEATEIDALSEKFQLIEARLDGHEAAQRSLARMDEGNHSQGRKTTAQGPGEVDYRVDAGRSKRDTSLALDSTALLTLQRQPFAGRHYTDLYGKPQEKNPFPSMDEFFTIIASNQFDPRLVRAASMSEGTLSEGGYLVPPDFAMKLLDDALEQSILWSRVRVEPMVSKTKEVGTFDNFGTTGGAPFGLSLQWKPENGPWSEQVAKTRNILLTAKVAGIYVPFSNELGDDGGQSFSSLLETAVKGALAFGIDDSMINGNGAGTILGILNSPSLIGINKEVGQLADTILWENIVNAYSRLHPSCVADSIWLANPNTLPQLLTMSLGTMGNSFYPALNEGSGGLSLLGRPLFLTEKCATLGDKGDVILCSPQQIILGLRRDVTVKLDQSVKFATDQTVLKVSVRLDSQTSWPSTHVPKNGATTSWAVTLNAR